MKHPDWKISPEVGQPRVNAIDYKLFDAGNCAEAVAAAKILQSEANIRGQIALG
jgi:hypothetical protein